MRDAHTEHAPADTTDEMADRSWYPIYAAVLVFAVLVISALWAFSHYFGS